MVIETIVPLNDVCFSNKITRPCKEYSVIFILNDPSYQLSWHSFGFMEIIKTELLKNQWTTVLKSALKIGFCRRRCCNFHNKMWKKACL